MKTKNLILLGLMLCSTFSMNAQVTDAEKKLKTVETDTVKGWKTGGIFGANLAQTALVNWSAGGQSSIAFNGLFSAFANYKKGNAAWDNSLDIGYGLLNQGGGVGFRKTDDKIEFVSKYGKRAFSNFYYAELLSFKTQFSTGYNYISETSKTKISNFLAPAYLIGAVGLNYQPSSYFNAFLAPFTGKLTIVNDEFLSSIGAFGVDPGKSTKEEFGGYMRVAYSRNDFKAEVLKNISFTTKLDLFSNYLKDPQNVDVNWETLIGMKVNKYISININTQLLYDADTKFDTNNDGLITAADKSRVQFKEIFGLGVMYKF